MKTTRTLSLLLGFVATLVIISCQKSDVSGRAESRLENTEATTSSQPGIRLENGSILSSSGVTITAPEQVNVDETFNISAAVTCGRIAIERGYVFAPDGVTKIYKDLACSPDLYWENVVQFQCASVDASANYSFSEPGTYVFRTKHNATKSGQCSGAGNVDCSFSGNEFCCFVIEAVDACVTEFKGEVNYCDGGVREAVYTFTSEEQIDYFKIQGGLTNFTGPDDAEVDVVGGSEIVKWQGTPGGSSNRTIRVEGKIGACETVTITVRWNSSNSGGVITGNWSVKGIDGLDIANPVEGLTCGN